VYNFVDEGIEKIGWAGVAVALQRDVVTRTHDVVGLQMQLAQKHEKLQHLFRQVCFSHRFQL
jgi:hypothetical protein